MTEDNHPASWKGRSHPFATSLVEPRIVDHTDLYSSEVEGGFLRKDSTQIPVVHVPENGVCRSKIAQLFEHRPGHQVSRVKNRVDSLENLEDFLGQVPCPPGNVGVGDNPYPHYPDLRISLPVGTFRPGDDSRVTIMPSIASRFFRIRTTATPLESG